MQSPSCTHKLTRKAAAALPPALSLLREPAGRRQRGRRGRAAQLSLSPEWRRPLCGVRCHLPGSSAPASWPRGGWPTACARRWSARCHAVGLVGEAAGHARGASSHSIQPSTLLSASRVAASCYGPALPWQHGRGAFAAWRGVGCPRARVADHLPAAGVAGKLRGTGRGRTSVTVQALDQSSRAVKEAWPLPRLSEPALGKHGKAAGRARRLVLSARAGWPTQVGRRARAHGRRREIPSVGVCFPRRLLTFPGPPRSAGVRPARRVGRRPLSRAANHLPAAGAVQGPWRHHAWKRRSRTRASLQEAFSRSLRT